MAPLGTTLPRVGIAGWDYADWKGTVYPRKYGKQFDRLEYISGFVDVVEVNSSFYRPVDPRTAESWVRRTARRENFTFTAKAHRGWTHDRHEDPAGSVRTTLEGLQPLADAGRFGALLVQFPHSFRNSSASIAWAERLFDLAPGWPLVLELRHRSWADERAADWLAQRDVGWCVVDQPRVGGAIPVMPRATSRVGYVRLHGRNAADWFRPGAGRDARYDYRYSRPQLVEVTRTVEEVAAATEELYVIQNNHFRGQALANALELVGLLRDVKPPAPPELVATYPDLLSEVSCAGDRLF